MKLRRTVITALLAAFLSILCPLSVGLGGVPVSLGTFCMCLLALVIDRRCALMALMLYVLLGAVGLPVFAGFSGGAHVLVGPTGGYLFGYIPMVTVVSLIGGRQRNLLRMALGMALGHVICYGFGAVWYAVQANMSLWEALAVGVLPFLLFDAVKMVAAGALALLLGPRVERMTRFYENGDREK